MRVSSINKKRKPRANPLRFDPTRTQGLRRRISAEIARRFEAEDFAEPFLDSCLAWALAAIQSEGAHA